MVQDGKWKFTMTIITGWTFLTGICHWKCVVIHKFWENLLFNLEIEPRTSVLLTNANVMKQRCTNHYNQWIHLLLKLLQLTKWNRENIMRWASNPILHEYKFNMLSWTISRLTIAEPGHSINIQNIEQNRKKISW